VKAVRRNFAGLRKLLDEEGLARGADVILADLGVSSMQLDDPSRGFSWKHDVPLDLRMNPQRGLPAGELLLKMKKEEIEDLLRRYGDEPHAHEIAAALRAKVDSLRAAPPHESDAARPASAHIHLPGNPLRTSDVTRAVESAYEGRTSRDASEAKKSSLQRTFQALRILVNDELTALDAFLRDLPSCLAPGGRAAILTFHSGEDRRVKKAFKAGLDAGLYARVADAVARAQAVATIIKRVFETISIAGTSVVSRTSVATNAVFKLSLNRVSSVPVTVQYQTMDGSALAGFDYQPKTVTLMFSPDDTNLTLAIPVYASPVWQPTRTFSVFLFQPQQAVLGIDEALGTILNSNTVPPLAISNLPACPPLRAPVKEPSL